MSRFASSLAVIDLNAYAQNLSVIRECLPVTCRMAPVVKADAYGHGAAPVARCALRSGASMLAVATVGEGVELRITGITAPILVLVQPAPDLLAAAVEHDLRITVSDVATARRLGSLAGRSNRTAVVHCKIDTGMGRQGLAFDSAAAAIGEIASIPRVIVEGIATHFPVADDPEDMFTAHQIRRFRELLQNLAARGIAYGWAHAANSAAIVHFPDAAFDMVRPGLMTYGVWPGGASELEKKLRPVLRWETRVVSVRELSRGATVGYGRTYTAPASMRAAVLPVGYADGYKFALSNRGEVLIHGRRCPVLGRVSMDQIVVDVSRTAGVAPGDTATLIGADGTEAVSVSELARLAGTIPYDILTGIGRRVARVYVGGEQE